MRRLARLGLTLIALACGCRNPFLPPIGDPEISGRLRTSPDGLLRQLIFAYETRQISLMQDLLDENTFRFYVSPRVIDDLRNLDKSQTEYIPASAIPYVEVGTYAYVTFQQEIAIHRNLFAHATILAFTRPPTVDAVVYHDSLIRIDSTVRFDTVARGNCDTLLCPDSLWVNGDTVIYPVTVYRRVYDTLALTILSSGAELVVSANEILAEYGKATDTFDFGAQVFHASRQPDSLWKISRWFELDY